MFLNYKKMEEKKKKKQKEGLFDEFMDYVSKKQKFEQKVVRRCGSFSTPPPPSESSDCWPTEYLNESFEGK